MRICTNCKVETKDIPCPNCGGGSFQNIKKEELKSDVEMLMGDLRKSKNPEARIAGSFFDMLWKIKRG